MAKSTKPAAASATSGVTVESQAVPENVVSEPTPPRADPAPPRAYSDGDLAVLSINQLEQLIADRPDLKARARVMLNTRLAEANRLQRFDRSVIPSVATSMPGNVLAERAAQHSRPRKPG